MVRVFYLVLYTATLAAGVAHWSRWKDVDIAWSLLGTRVANAQQPAGDPNYGTDRTSYNGGMPNSTIVMPGAAATRPDAWPGAPPVPGAAAPLDPNVSQAVALEDTRILARVGATEVVLATEVLRSVNEAIERNLDRIPKAQVEEFRTQLIKQRLEELIQTKCLLAEARGKVPPEGFKQITERMREQFDTVEVPKVMQKLELNSPAELDAWLHKTGGSLDRERRQFVERTLAISWVQQQVRKEAPRISPEQLWDYYTTHADDFAFEAKARWEQLTVRYDRVTSKEQAYARLAEAGNQVLAGADFATVARQISQGPTAAEGGVHDWTQKGSLVSTVLDQALFTQQVGQLSPILEDAQGFHIIRVIERQDAGRTPFPEAQAEIRKKIEGGHQDHSIEDYVTALRKRTRVTTIFDNPAETAHAGGPQDLPVNPYQTALPSQ